MAQQHLHQNASELTGKAGFEALLNSDSHPAENDIDLSEDRGRTRREEWLSQLEILFQQVQDALRPYIESQRVSIEFRPFKISEEFVGEYTARKMLIKFANTEVVLEPAGTMVLAARGRLDVRGPFGKASLLLVNDKARRLADVSKWSLRSEERLVSSTQQPLEPTSWEWRVVSKSPDRELISLTEEVILGLFTDVANG